MVETFSTLGFFQAGHLKVTHEARPPGFVGPQKACHPEAFELSLIFRGSADVSVGRSVDSIHSGLYGIVPAGMEHSSKSPESGTEECNVHLPLEWIERASDDHGYPHPDIPFGSFASTPEVRHIVGALASTVGGGDWPGKEQMISALCHSLSLWLVGHHLSPSGGHKKDNGTWLARRLERVEELLRGAPEQAYTIEELAQVAGLSRFRFLRAFKEKYGLPPYAFLLRLRVERGEDLVKNTDVPLTVIAHDLGFGSASRFTESFKRAYGCTPSAVRARSGKQTALSV